MKNSTQNFFFVYRKQIEKNNKDISRAVFILARYKDVLTCHGPCLAKAKIY